MEFDDEYVGWSTDEDQELVKKVKETTKEQDKVSYKTRLKQLDWRTIAFKAYSADECEKRFHNHLKHVRRHRNLSEITTDIETNIKKCPLKKPLNAYQLFVQDQLTNVKSSGDFVSIFLFLFYLLLFCVSEFDENYVYFHFS